MGEKKDTHTIHKNRLSDCSNNLLISRPWKKSILPTKDTPYQTSLYKCKDLLLITANQRWKTQIAPMIKRCGGTKNCRSRLSNLLFSIGTKHDAKFSGVYAILKSNIFNNRRLRFTSPKEKKTIISKQQMWNCRTSSTNRVCHATPLSFQPSILDNRVL